MKKQTPGGISALIVTKKKAVMPTMPTSPGPHPLLMNDRLQWRANLPGMFKEILEHNDQMSIFRQPFNIIRGILVEMGERAAQLNDPELNAIMVRLSIYDVGDPYSGHYDPKMAQKVINAGLAAKRKRIAHENPDQGPDIAT